MGRFSPTVRPIYPHEPGLFERLGDVADEVLPYWEARRQRKRQEAADVEAREMRDLELGQEGIFRGRALPAEVEVAPTGSLEARLPGPESDVMEGSLGRSRRRGLSLYDRLDGQDGLAVAPAPAPGGAAAPVRQVEPGAYNPVRGDFEPAFPVGGETVRVPDAGMNVRVPNTRQITENYYIDDDQTPEGRKAAAMSGRIQAAIDAGILTPQDAARAEILGLDDAVDYRDEATAEAAEIAEAEANTEANRRAHTAYIESLRQVAPNAPAPPFDDRVNWASENVELARDVRNEGQIRSRPSSATSPGGGSMTNATARRFLDNTFGGFDEIGGRDLPAAQVLGALDYERLATALETGQITREAVDANQAKILAGKLDEVLAGWVAHERKVSGTGPQTLGEAADDWTANERAAREAIQGLPREEAIMLLRRSEYTDEEIAQILR